jgi:hypothetical protein
MLNIISSIQFLFRRKEKPLKGKKEPLKDKKERLNYQSGYFSPDGTFYGCSAQGHIDLADRLIKINGYLNHVNAQQILEKDGWIKMTNDELFYFNFNKRPTQAQIDSIFDHFKYAQFKFNLLNMTLNSLITYIERNYNGLE